LTGVVLQEKIWFALLFAWAGTTLSGCISFFIARILGRQWVADHETERWHHFDKTVRERGFITILLLRVMIFIPYDAVSIASGVSSIRFSSFVWATVLGVLPEVTAQVLIGHDLINFRNLVILGIFLFCALLLGYFLKTHPHFRQIINPIERIKKIRTKRKQKKNEGS
jgi:uncharacterized membrane protein YdjX (TVP38/TMEM64 family)